MGTQPAALASVSATYAWQPASASRMGSAPSGRRLTRRCAGASSKRTGHSSIEQPFWAAATSLHTSRSTTPQVNRLGFFRSVFPNATSPSCAMKRCYFLLGLFFAVPSWLFNLQDCSVVESFTRFSSSPGPCDPTNTEIWNFDWCRSRGPPTELVELGDGFKAMAKALHERQLQLKFHTEQQLGKAERLAMIGRLSAGVAHEINNPLGGILLFSSLLLKNAAPDNRDRPALERICNEAKRCQQIVQGLLDFARPREPKREQIVLENVVDRTLQLVSGQSLFHNIEVVKDYAEPKPEGLVDPAQLQQVVLNLIVNAAEAMGGKGSLTLATRSVEDGTAAQIEIADSGCGIASENLERLFEPFFTTKEVGQGTGLGLSISRSIVESHNGTIWAESEVGAGTRFFIRLPTQSTGA